MKGSILSKHPDCERYYLARTGVVCHQETDSRQLKEVMVYCLHLVRQRIDAGNGECKVGIVLIGQTQTQGSDRKPEPGSVSIECLRGNGLKGSELRGSEDRFVDSSGVETLRN